ncbi:cobalt-precorrin-6A reductase [Kineosporia babensis]|uniref:Cobalt-precorrin-6A reductase n=1 Tax=Kineosporia babensis TaxID=499548 RepID=A0A9X1NAD6_9ACTN|nr:cobalt-precorrin-6A reductase [Kineosporia babensis]MCD5310171.1 cobalt-precorrin-6A reductase [Kineosporia babensis]
MKVLVLGGTGEGRTLAAELVTLGLTVISSLAGRVSSPRLPAGEVRIGGFGGAAGLAEFLAREEISAVVDATHPFAAGMTANAAQACAGTVPLLILRRPAWVPEPGDKWTLVPDIPSAAAILSETSPDTVVLLTTGRQETAAFAPLPQSFILRAVETPDGPLPKRCEVILDRGPFTLEGERELFASRNVQKLVTKNSGGPMTAAKLTAARERGIEVIMVERPPLPLGVPSVTGIDAARSWLEHFR